MKCKFCSAEFTSGYWASTMRLAAHIQENHPAEYSRLADEISRFTTGVERDYGVCLNIRPKCEKTSIDRES